MKTMFNSYYKTHVYEKKNLTTRPETDKYADP